MSRQSLAFALGLIAASAAAAQTSGTEGASAPNESAIDQRQAAERAAESTRFALTPHKPNYVLPLTYNSRANRSYEALEPWEIKFQLSFKFELARDFFGGNLLFGYTQQSYWQAFNRVVSSPFRETNYEPEVMWSYLRGRSADELRHRSLVLGFVHQSNGRSQPESRSWNRVYANFVFEYENLYFSLKPWYRIPEHSKNDPLDPRGDDNPDIQTYLGRGEATVMWIRGPNRYAVMLRNNFDSPNRGAIQVDWSYPIRGKLQGYVQYFNGYGESLIDYNHRVNRLGLGLMLNNWL
jgi:phospholipase A1